MTKYVTILGCHNSSARHLVSAVLVMPIKLVLHSGYSTPLSAGCNTKLGRRVWNLKTKLFCFSTHVNTPGISRIRLVTPSEPCSNY